MMHTPTGQSAWVWFYQGQGSSGLMLAGDWLRSSSQPVVGAGLGQLSLFGMVDPIIKHPFGVISAYMARTSLVACTWSTTHQAGMTIFFKVRFQKQIFTVLEPGQRSPYILVATTSLEQPCSLGSAITCTCLMWPITLLTPDMVYISKGKRMTSLGVVIGPLTVDKWKIFSLGLPSASCPAMMMLTYVFLQALVSSFKFCSFTICITFWITWVSICIGIP